MSKTNSAISGAAAGASVGGPWGAAIGGAAGFVMGSDDKSGDSYDQMMKQAQGLPLPVLKEYYPELYQQVVSLNPELETAVNLGPSQMQGVATDPALRQAQMNALNKLQEVGAAGGRDSQFLADNNQLQTDINSQVKGQQDAVMQNLATRGMGGSGNELVQREMAIQGGANRNAQSGMDLKAQADKRALDAIMNSGTLGGQIQSQDFSQQSAKAQAADEIAKFNTANRQQVMTNNTSAKNNAQQWNAQSAQTTANTNTQTRNAAQLQNNELDQKQFNNNLAKYGIVNQATTAAAANQASQSQAQDKFLGTAISAGATAYAGSQKKADDGYYNGMKKVVLPGSEA